MKKHLALCLAASLACLAAPATAQTASAVARRKALY